MFRAYCPCLVYRFVSECKTERNKSDVLWEDIQQTAERGNEE